MFLLLLLLSASALRGQQGLQMASLPPPPVDPGTISARVVGDGGGGLLYYWVVTRYPGGYAVQMLPAVASNAPGVGQLSGSRYVRVRWAPVPGATGYDVLRSNTAAYPAAAGSCSCAVVLNTTDNTVDDTGGVLSAFPSAGQLPAVGATAGLALDTANETYAFVNVSLVARAAETLRLGLLSGLFNENDCVKWVAGRLVSAGAACNMGGGGGGSPGGSNGQLQYNNAGAFGGSTWLASGNNLVPPAAGALAWSGRSILSTPADGYFLATNAAGSDFTCFALGGTSASYPAWCRSGTELRARTADNTAFVAVRAAGYVVDGATPTDCLLAGGTTGACSAGGAGYQQAVLLDLKPSISSPTVLSIDGGRCSGQTKAASTATITAGSGNGSFVAYCTDSQTIVVETAASAGVTVSCTNCVPLTVVTPEVPSGLFPIGSGTITTGQWATLADDRDWDTRLLLQDGLGIDIVCSGGHTCSIANDPAVVQLISGNYTPLADFDAAAATRTRLKTGAADPGACAVGDLFFNTAAAAGSNLKGCTSLNTFTTLGSGTTVAKNGVYLQLGSTNYLLPGMYAVTAPTTSGYSWLDNQGGATATTTGTGGALKLTLTTGTAGFRVYGKALAGATKFTAAIASPTWSDSGSAISVVGAGFRESGTGRLQMLRVQSNRASPNEVAASGFLSPTGFSYNLNYAPFNQSAGLLYLQGELTGGNVVFRVSTDGFNWMTVGSDTIGGFMTPDQVWVGGSAGSSEGQVLVYSLLVE